MCETSVRQVQLHPMPKSIESQSMLEPATKTKFLLADQRLFANQRPSHVPHQHL